MSNDGTAILRRRRAAWRMAAVALGAATYAPLALAQTACEAAEHGMRADGSDNSAAFTKALQECAGKALHIAHGTYVFAPNGFQRGFEVPADTSIVGDGPRGAESGQTVLRIADSGSFASLFWIRNVSRVKVYGLRFEGTPYESGCTRHLDYGHAITLYSDAGKSEPVEQVEITDNVFHDFNGSSWVTLEAGEGSPGIGRGSRIVIKNNTFDSDANLRGSCAANSPIAQSALMVSLRGSNKSAQGLVENVEIAANSFNAAYVKGAIATWSGTRNISITGNTIVDAGMRLPPYAGELGRYAITVYNSAHYDPGLHPEGIQIVGNTITNPVSAGVYVASAHKLEIRNNRISGQRDRDDATLPKGAIVLNHADEVSALDGNELSNNYIGIAAVSSNLPSGNNHIVAAPGGMAQKIR